MNVCTGANVVSCAHRLLSFLWMYLDLMMFLVLMKSIRSCLFSFFQLVPERSIVIVKSINPAQHKGTIHQLGRTSSLGGNNNIFVALHLSLEFKMIDSL